MIRPVAVLVDVSILAMSARPAAAAPPAASGDLVQIYQIQAAFDRASSAGNLDLMMSLWADDATLSVGAAKAPYRVANQARIWLLPSYPWLLCGVSWSHPASVLPQYREWTL
jgi:hypothetical protein